VRAVLRGVLVGAGCLLVLVESASAATFKVDPSRSSLVVQIVRDGVAGRLAHDHVVQATTFSGRVVHDPAAREASSIHLEVETSTLKADDPATRRKFGVRGEPSAADVVEIEQHMKAAEQLDVTRYPLVTFTSTAITAQAGGRYLVAGRLTIRGVTRTVEFPARVVMDGHALHGTATLAFKQSAFGYKPYSALMGAIKNKDEVTLHIDLMAVPE
jgi:polyisoprenoid-binding protein YceI